MSAVRQPPTGFLPRPHLFTVTAGCSPWPPSDPGPPEVEPTRCRDNDRMGIGTFNEGDLRLDSLRRW
jgi:hypothetical protein